MPPKFKRHLNDDDVTGSVRSERRNLLEDDSDEEEDFFLRGPSGPRFGPRNDKIKHVQNQVDEVIDVMQENITKVIERGERLDELQDKSESLSDNATAFSNRSKQLRRQMWWRGCKAPFPGVAVAGWYSATVSSGRSSQLHNLLTPVEPENNGELGKS
ncbi:vesicle-associated membrane protein 4 isoform X2 [Elephas maximus indicus]|uniref:vesicle-associated membrane protein 4 isoform X2 n=1 Tax=Elephas maximus indicus TaxID=99487 RepID=UPI002115D47E|nr:vesicle-associated membrane protein 4 isoform X2 [Elephas maximus indicus]